MVVTGSDRDIVRPLLYPSHEVTLHLSWVLFSKRTSCLPRNPHEVIEVNQKFTL